MASEGASIVASDGYALVAFDDDSSPADTRVSLTAALGCTDTTVDAYRLEPGDSAALPTDPETVCVPLDAAGELVVDDAIFVPSHGIARVPAGVGASVQGEDETVWLVIGAATEPAEMARPTVVDPATVEFAPTVPSGILTTHLTEPLGCTGMKINCRRLEPGDAIPYHTEGTQEELFVPLDGPGTLRVAGETYRMPRYSVARVAPDVPRAVVNEGAEDRLWFMVGAPPTGGADDWDPGFVILDWPGDE